MRQVQSSTGKALYVGQNKNKVKMESRRQWTNRGVRMCLLCLSSPSSPFLSSPFFPIFLPPSLRPFLPSFLFSPLPVALSSFPYLHKNHSLTCTSYFFFLLHSIFFVSLLLSYLFSSSSFFSSSSSLFFLIPSSIHLF